MTILSRSEQDRINRMPLCSKDREFLIEECAELIFALQKMKRKKDHNVEEEIADVQIMLCMVAQHEYIDQCEVGHHIAKKLKKMEKIRTKTVSAKT